MKKLLLHYAKYNVWANTLLAETAAEHPSILNTEVKSSFPSLLKTFIHIAEAEKVWLLRLQGTSLAQLSDAAVPHTPESVIVTSEELYELIEGMNDDFFNSIITYTNTKGQSFKNSAHIMMMHCLNHSTFHRGQIVTIMRELGLKEIPATDLIVYQRVMEKVN